MRPTASRYVWGVLLAGVLAVAAGVLFGVLTADRASVPVGEQISAGAYHTCARLDDGRILCWGLDNAGQLGGGLPGPIGSKEYVENVFDAADLQVGGEHSCLVDVSGRVRCWGHNGNGQLGDGTVLQRWLSTPVRGLAERVVGSSLGRYHTCVFDVLGGAYCWGRNSRGQLGDGSNLDRVTPTRVDGVTDVSGLAAGDGHTCALHTSGKVSCWGQNSSGQLGDMTNVDRPAPVPVEGVVDATAIAAGDHHTCVLTAKQTVLCWGRNSFRELGDGTTAERSRPVEVIGVSDAVTVTAGEHHTCALREEGTAVCWGWDSSGQLGRGGRGKGCTIFVCDPAPVLLEDVTSIDAGGTHTCAIARAEVHCWGQNGNGQLGDLTTETRSSLLRVSLVPGTRR